MKYDPSNMYEIIMQSPAQFSAGYIAAESVGNLWRHATITQTVIAGMGGSALPAELLELFSKTLGVSIPVMIHKNYGLPDAVDTTTLVIVISYSGNTEEALSAYDEARAKKHMLTVITSGGTLQKNAERDSAPLIVVPKKVPPRLAVGYQFAALVGLCVHAGIIPDQKELMNRLSQSLDSEKARSAGEALAKKIKDRIPLFYADEFLGPLAYILKIQVNENAKRHAFWNVFPELNHNELVGFETKGPFMVIMLRYDASNVQTRKRINLTQKLLEKRGIPVETIDISGKNLYNEVFNTILMGNWTSYYLAIQDNIDPTPVTIVEELKKQL